MSEEGALDGGRMAGILYVAGRVEITVHDFVVLGFSTRWAALSYTHD